MGNAKDLKLNKKEKKEDSFTDHWNYYKYLTMNII
jgi:hypothetical protein